MSLSKIYFPFIVSLVLCSTSAVAQHSFYRDDSTMSRPAAVDSTFTQTGTGATASTVDAKLKNTWVSVTDFGADPTGVADSTTAIANAYNRVAAMGGGTLFFPPGTYLATILPTIAQNGVVFQCSGNGAEGGGTRLAQTSTSGDFLTITGQHDWVRNCEFEPTVRVTSGYQVVFNGSFQSGIEYGRIERAYSGIHVYNGNETHITEMSIRSLMGFAGIRYDGTVSIQSYGLTMSTVIMDNPYPLAYGPVKAWGTSTGYTAGDIVRVNGNIYQCSTSGTSASGGSGPSGLPSGTTPASAFSNTITDGTAQWKFVAATLNWIWTDSYATSTRMNNVNTINGYNGWLVTDSVGSGTSHPKFNMINNLETDHTFADGIRLEAGVNNEIVNSWFGSSLTANGVETTSTYRAALMLHGSRVTGNWTTGVLLGGGVQNIIDHNLIASNSISGSGSAHGINVAAGVEKFVIGGNYLGLDNDIGSNNQGYGVYIATGGSDYYNVVNNICGAENVSGCVSDNGTGLNKTVTGNH